MSRSNEVDWVSNSIGRGARDVFNFSNFIKKYLSEYEKLRRSFEKFNEEGEFHQPGIYFLNFIETCRDSLLSNKRYFHYDRKTCIKFGSPGPTRQYSELLKYIVINSKNFNRDDARKIHVLLFWFEQYGLSFMMIAPLNKISKEIFEENNIPPGYFGEEDGTMKYCSIRGKLLENGMEISNTRVNALLNKIHKLGDDEEEEDDAPAPVPVPDPGPVEVDGGGFRGKRRSNKKNKYHCTSRSTRSRSSTKRRRHTRRRRRH
jgi:hypothetical protein